VTGSKEFFLARLIWKVKSAYSVEWFSRVLRELKSLFTLHLTYRGDMSWWYLRFRSFFLKYRISLTWEYIWSCSFINSNASSWFIDVFMIRFIFWPWRLDLFYIEDVIRSFVLSELMLIRIISVSRLIVSWAWSWACRFPFIFIIWAAYWSSIFWESRPCSRPVKPGEPWRLVILRRKLTWSSFLLFLIKSMELPAKRHSVLTS